MNTIGILGCGWLGIPLGKVLKQKGYSVRGSRRGEDGVRLLKKNGLDPYLIQVLSDKVKGDLSFFDKLDTLIISIPPERKNNASYFSQKIETLINVLHNTPINRIIFLSSTSVYGSSAGIFDENSIPKPEKSSAKNLLIAEESFSNFSVPSVIVRLGGLIGEDRNPIVHFKNKKISNPEGCINFIHQVDAIRGISSLIENPINEGIYNLVSPHHPLRREYYTAIAKKLKLPEPQFEKDTQCVRIIKSDKIMRDTSFEYNVNNLLI